MKPLIEHLMGHYGASPYVVELQGAFGTAAEAAAAAREDLFAQLEISTATWGLALWEEMYDLPVDVAKDLEFRRSRLRSKMRSVSTSTPEMIQNVAESFSNGQVEVLEYPAEARFEVKFVGTIGVPPNMEDLTAALEEIKPAHLSYTYVITYRLHRSLKSYRHSDLEQYSHGTIKGGDIGGQ